LIRFVKHELRGIEADARKGQDLPTAHLSEHAIALLDTVWQAAARRSNESVESHSSERDGELSEAAEDVVFDLTLRRHFGWLRQNWRSVLPNC
jgi:hypothetical protein